MKRSYMLASAVALFLAAATSALAQGPVRPVAPPPGGPVARQAPGPIALLDVTWLFDKHQGFKQAMNEMKADVERAESDMKAQREGLRKMQERAESLKGKDPREYKATEENIARIVSEMELKVRMQRKDFMEREARIYHNVYREIQQEVQYFADANGISLVLKFTSETVDVENPQSVLGYLNRPMVYHAQQLDITPYIWASLKARRGWKDVPETVKVPGPPNVFGPR